jgi:hypothetical protein
VSTDLPASAAPPVPGSTRVARRRPRWRRPLLEALAVVAVFAAVGAGAGWLWFRLWDPPIGGVQDGTWLYPDFPAFETDFGGTALYVVIGAAAGLLLGVAAAYAFQASELVTLLAVAAGSVLAAWVAHRVGVSLSPPDPEPLAAALPDGAELPGALDVTGRSPFVAWPVGALVGLATTYLLTGSVSAGVEATRPFDAGPGRPTSQG